MSACAPLEIKIFAIVLVSLAAVVSATHALANRRWLRLALIITATTSGAAALAILLPSCG